MTTEQPVLFTENGVPLLPEKHRKELLKSLRDNLSDLVFRRVARVYTTKKDLIEVRYYTDSNTCSAASGNLKDYKKQEFEQNIEFRHKKYYFFTSHKRMRENDEYSEEEIFCESRNYAQLDLTDNVSLDFSRYTNCVPPRVGDLVCMMVERVSSKPKPHAKFWFTCSDQFLRAWTLLMYDKHQTFEANGVEPRMRDRYMSGNRLNTNSFLKWKLANIQNKVESDENEVKKRFWNLRTEYISKNYVNVYSVLVLMARYGELPCSANIPVNKPSPAQVRNGISPPVMKKWNIPKRFVEGILACWTTYTPEIHNMDWFTLNKLSHSFLPVLNKKEKKELPPVPMLGKPIEIPPPEVESPWVKAVNKKPKEIKQTEEQIKEHERNSEYIVKECNWGDFV